MSRLNVMWVSASLAVILIGYANCAKLQSASLNQSSQSQSSNGSGVNESGAAVAQFANVTPLTMKLGDKVETQIQVTPSTSYVGDVAFEIDRSMLSIGDGQQDIRISVNPNTVRLNGQPVSVKLTIETAVSAPSFDLQALKIKAIPLESGARTAETKISLKVAPEVEIKMYGGAVPANRWDRPASMNFRKHAQPLVLNFVNYDTASTHIVHGIGFIPHQDTNRPLARAPASGMPGGSYKVTVSSTATQAQYYYHDIENPSFSRSIMANLDNPNSQFVQSLSQKVEEESLTNSTEPHPSVLCPMLEYK